MSCTTARLSTMPAAITACAMRKTRKTSAEGASSVPTVAARNRPSDHRITFRRPNLSEIGPTATCRRALSPR